MVLPLEAPNGLAMITTAAKAINPISARTEYCESWCRSFIGAWKFIYLRSEFPYFVYKALWCRCLSRRASQRYFLIKMARKIDSRLEGLSLRSERGNSMNCFPSRLGSRFVSQRTRRFRSWIHFANVKGNWPGQQISGQHQAVPGGTARSRTLPTGR